MPAIYRSSSSVSILRTAKTIFLNQREHFTRALRPPLSATCRSGSPHVRLRSAGDHRVLPSAQGKRALSSRAGPKPHNEPTRTPERYTPLSLSYKSPLGNSRRASQPPTCTALPTRNSLLRFGKPPTRLTATCTALLVLRSLPRGSAIQCKSSANPASPSQYSLWLLSFLTDAHSSSTQLQTTLPGLSNPHLTSTCQLLTPTLPHSCLVPHSQPPPHSPINTTRPWRLLVQHRSKPCLTTQIFAQTFGLANSLSKWSFVLFITI